MNSIPILLLAVLSGPNDTPDNGWWSYRPLERPSAPVVVGEAWVESPIDAFILARLEEAGLAPAPPADRVSLIRRATYDLTGLPPTPAEVDAFVADTAADAWSRLVDRLLASPQYGEKWGRHWLDLVRFAETDSYERDRLKPSAWKYRDYVIDAFNADKPYDRFLLEQLAGDELDRPTLETTIATGYYRLGIWDDEPTDVLQAQYDDLDSILATTSQVVLGMSINCARCHDHKRDPIPQADYYRLLAFFENIKPYKQGGGNATTPQNFLADVPVDLGASRFDEQLAAYHAERAGLAGGLADLRDRAGGEPVVPDDLVGHWSFDEHEAAGRLGAARAFDGADDFIRFERPVQDDFTISLWLRTEHEGPGGGDHRWFLGAGLVDGEIPGIVRDFGLSYHSDGRVTAGVGQPETFLHSPPGLHDGAWHHVAMTRHRASGLVRLYVDGEQVSERTGTTEPLDAPEHLDIGRMHPGHRYFKGDLDDIRIYPRTLDPRAVLEVALVTEGLEASLGEEEARRYRQLLDDRMALRRPTRDMTRVLCVQERGPHGPEGFIRERGNASVKGEPVAAGFPVVLGAPDPTIPTTPDDAPTSGRRRTLAEWIIGPSNIRTARVMANRLWQHHFGRGLSRTPNDFGRLGQKPTHPDLLDWLAVELREGGWTLKRMHRLIMASSAYHMSSRYDERAFAADPQNDLHWRFDLRRLTAEEIRDSMLAVNGTLNLKMGGPGVYPAMPEEILATSSRPGQAWGRSSPEEAARRSVYIHVKRSLISPLLSIFDLADTDFSCPVRFATTQPTQALTMLNSDFVNEQARLLADRLRAEAGAGPADRIRLALRLTCGREPVADEVEQGVAFMRELERDFGLDAEGALDRFCLVALNLNEFVFLD